mmetsp:Transcript_36730/g.90686  ORF Transcript_36730/g.90686 Transcript_36730/m.90686 type:complete len:248 (+) Transcript_36730:302-1045(+)
MTETASTRDGGLGAPLLSSLGVGTDEQQLPPLLAEENTASGGLGVHGGLTDLVGNKPGVAAGGVEKLGVVGGLGGGGYVDPQNSYFECNICLELAQDPIVTQCGHLFCWPCIYKWMQVFPEAQQCPVCKAGVSEELVIPLYGRGTCGSDPRRKSVVGSNVPMRPQGLRVPAQTTALDHEGGLHAQGAMPISNLGWMNSLLGFGFQFGVGVGTSLLGEPMSPEQQQQAFLSRLLLLLGSFVIVCLLIF